MASRKELLEQIEALRKSRRDANEKIYSARTNLIKTDKLIGKIQRQETNPANAADVKAIRSKISANDHSALAITKRLAEIGELTIQLNGKRDLLKQVQNKLVRSGNESSLLSKQLATENNKPVKDRKKIETLRGRLELIKKTTDSLRADLAVNQREADLLERREQASAAEKRLLSEELGSIKKTSEELIKSLNEKTKGAPVSLSDTLEKKAAFEKTIRSEKAGVSFATDQLQLAINSLYPDIHPRNALSGLDDTIPILLFPLRLETRFKTDAANPELWVRVYPDEFLIHTHEKDLTEAEVKAGQAYWKSIFTAGKNYTDLQSAEEGKKQAWAAIIDQFGAQRSAWIASQTKPLNWTSDFSLPANAASLQFPVPQLIKTSSWSRAPRTELMPDKIVLLLYIKDELVHEVTGELIPDELYMGPDPLNADAGFDTAADGKLVFGEDYNWTSDFGKAVSLGLGFKVPLTPSQVINGFDKIIALGVSISSDETVSQKNLSDLIDNHHYSPKGFYLVTQGTPTNNTEQNSSGYSTDDRYNPDTYYIETGDPLFGEDSDCDGKNLAEALGIGYEAFHYIQNSDGTDLKEAIMMNKALYPSTLGYYFESLLKPVLSADGQSRLRDFFITNVTGRGPLPAFRTGNQPYGIVVTSDFTRWTYSGSEAKDSFLTVLLSVLRYYDGLWTGLSSKISYAGKPGMDPSEGLLNILGLHASSVSFAQRVAYSTDDLREQDQFKYGGKYFNDLKDSFTSKNQLLTFLNSFGFSFADANGNLKIPQLLRLVFQHYHTPLNSSGVVDSKPLTEDKPVSFYNPDLKKNYMHWLSEAESIDALEKQDFGAGVAAPTSLLYLQLRRSLLLALAESTVNWFGRHGIDLNAVKGPVNFYNINSDTTSKWEVMRAKIAHALPDHELKNKPAAEYLLGAAGSGEPDAFLVKEIKAAIAYLAGKSSASLERSFTEHLDTCSYRLDAWQTALFDQRLKKQRQAVPRSSSGSEQPKKGIYLGAYGWLENVRPAAKKAAVPGTYPSSLQPAANEVLYEYDANGGFIHAPSLNQATAAAILRNGYLSHASSEQPDLLAVNLSSERIRRALFILEGIRNGQRLEALLGFQFERGLHDAGSSNDDLKILNSYIYYFRDRYPIEITLLPGEGQAAPDEVLPKTYVTNGLTLSANSSPFPYNTAIDISAFPAPRQTAIIAAVSDQKDKLADTLDAIKDLLLSESIYQMVSGNTDRSAAVLNAIKNAQAIPEPEIIKTPRGSQLSYTNRVTIQFDTPDPAEASSNPWPQVAMTARAKMEPGLNKWLAGYLGSGERVFCVASYTGVDGVLQKQGVRLDSCGLQPIDLVYSIATGNLNGDGHLSTIPEDLQRRILFYFRNQHGLAEDVTVSLNFDSEEATAGSLPGLLSILKTMVTGSRAIHAADFQPASRTDLTDPVNPEGFIDDELSSRIRQAVTDLSGLYQKLNALPVSQTTGDTIHEITLQLLFSQLSAGKTLSVLEYSFENVNALLLLQILISISCYGFPVRFPVACDVLDEKGKALILQQAADVIAITAQVIETTNKLLQAASDVLPGTGASAKRVDILISAGKALLGEDFNILPRFNYSNPADIQLSNQDRDSLLSYAINELKMPFPAAEWSYLVSHVRPKMQALERLHLLNELLNDVRAEPKPIQVPYRENDRWLSVEYPATNADGSPFSISDNTLSVTIHGGEGCFTASPQSGILVDDWTELIPVNKEITGISFNYNQPNAMAPQALLLAVTPVETGQWSWDNLLGIVHDTLRRAKLRAVEPALLDTSDRPEAGILLPALLANFSQEDLDFALDYRVNVAFYNETVPMNSLTV